MTCEFDGHTFASRGLATAEAVTGHRLFTTPYGDSAIAEWECRTAATMTSEARCQGRASWVGRTGRSRSRWTCVHWWTIRFSP